MSPKIAWPPAKPRPLETSTLLPLRSAVIEDVASYVDSLQPWVEVMYALGGRNSPAGFPARARDAWGAFW